MAYNEGSEVEPGLSNDYGLGNYIFQVTSAYYSQSNRTDIIAYCHQTGEGISKSAVKTTSVSGEATVLGWHVEADENVASVYARIKKESGIVQPFIPSSIIPGATYGDNELRILHGASREIRTAYMVDHRTVDASLTPISTRMYNARTHGWGASYGASNYFSYNGKTVYYGSSTTSSFDYWNTFGGGHISAKQTLSAGMLAWIMFYGGSGGEEDILVAQFAIDLIDAGGGPGGGWDIPGDTGDPSYTLSVSVDGATSGAHSDLYNASDNESEKGYGFGGDGGHGGGGGAGASTTIIYDFATDKAGAVVQTATAKAPGYGGMGGKGGKGGDGCILIFY